MRSATGFPRRECLRGGGVRVGLVHGEGGPKGIVERVLKHFAGDAVRVVVFGHSHQALVEEREGVLAVNPGSPTDGRWAPYHSVAVLQIEEGKAEARIVRI